jgi:hypothetical protein
MVPTVGQMVWRAFERLRALGEAALTENAIRVPLPREWLLEMPRAM